MSDYTAKRLGGAILVTHETAPRFNIALERQRDGSWSSTNDIEWLDSPPLDAPLLARLMREAGDAALLFLKTETN